MVHTTGQNIRVKMGMDRTNEFRDFHSDSQRITFHNGIDQFLVMISDHNQIYKKPGLKHTEGRYDPLPGWHVNITTNGATNTISLIDDNPQTSNPAASTNFVPPETTIRWAHAHAPLNTAMHPNQYAPSYALHTPTPDIHETTEYMHGALPGQAHDNTAFSAYSQPAAATSYQSQPSSDQSYYVQPVSPYAAQGQPSAVAQPSYLHHSISQPPTQSDRKAEKHDLESLLEAITKIQVDHSKGTENEIADRDKKMMHQLAVLSKMEKDIIENSTHKFTILDREIKTAIEGKQKEIRGDIYQLSHLTNTIHKEKLRERLVKQRYRNERHAETHRHLTTMHGQHDKTHEQLKDIHDQHGETHQHLEKIHDKLNNLMEKHQTRTGADEDGKVALQYFKAAHKIPDGLFIKALNGLGSDSASLRKLEKILDSNEREATQNKARMERLSALHKKLKESKDKHQNAEYKKHRDGHHFENIKRFIPDYKGHIESEY